MSGAAYRNKAMGMYPKTLSQAKAVVAFDRSQLAQDQRKAQAIARKNALAIQRAGVPGGMVPRGFMGQLGEAKYVDIANAVYVLNGTGTIAHMSIIPQNSTVNGKIGRKAELTYFQIRGQFSADTTSTVQAYAAYLVWDAQPVGALPAIAGVVLDTADAYSFPKRENVQRFRILRKWTGVLSGNITTPATGQEVTRIDDYIRLPKGLVVVSKDGDTTGVIGNIANGALYLVTVGTIGAGTADGNLTVTCRTGFRDQ